MEPIPAHPITVKPPAELSEWLALLGSPERLHAFLEAFGGTRLAVPKYATARCQLARIVGLEAAGRVAAEFGGINVKVPLARHWRIRICHSWGWSYSAIARKFCITERGVHSNLQAAGLTDAPDATCARMPRGRSGPTLTIAHDPAIGMPALSGLNDRQGKRLASRRIGE